MTEAFVLRQAGIAGADSLVSLLRQRIEGTPPSGPYLEWFNVDGNNGYGADTWTYDLQKALRFPSKKAAIEAWQTQSKVTPLRDDGKPNRPLTAYNVVVQKIEEAR